MKEEFNTWWHSGESLTDNPYELDCAAYWAWEGWCAAVKAEREACAQVAEDMLRFYTQAVTGVPQAIRARGQA